MNRREFIIKSSSLLIGNYLCFNWFSRAFGASVETDIQPRVSIIIDDIGYSMSKAQQFLDLELPVTFSILPHLEHSRSTALKIHNMGHDIMLHQPMEPFNSNLNPGPGALYKGFETDWIKEIVSFNISSIPNALGVNNHMGSRFTGCQREMTDTLKIFRDRQLFFVDSLTSGRSKGFKIAANLGMSTTKRNIFLDNVKKESAILVQLNKLKLHALRYGKAIGIGHPFPATARAIRKFASDNFAEISMVHISEII